MTKVKVCLVKDMREKIVEIEGEDYGIVTVAPVIDIYLRPHPSIYAVRSSDTGGRIASFKAKHVAENFARRINEIGEPLRTACINSMKYAETPEDSALLDYIDMMSRHPLEHRQSNLVPTKKNATYPRNEMSSK